MSTEQIVLLIVALVAANLPFTSQRLFFLIRLSAPRKAWYWHLLELAVMYGVVGGLAYLLESKLGGAQPQKWEFYAITSSLFLVLAYPGYVWRYMWRK